MPALSNLPPGGGFYHDGETIALRCPAGHEWEAPGYFEFGGWFLHDEDDVACPVEGCGLDAEE